MTTQELKDLLEDVADKALSPTKAYAILEDEMDFLYGNATARLDLVTEDGE